MSMELRYRTDLLLVLTPVTIRHWLHASKAYPQLLVYRLLLFANSQLFLFLF